MAILLYSFKLFSDVSEVTIFTFHSMTLAVTMKLYFTSQHTKLYSWSLAYQAINRIEQISPVIISINLFAI